MTPKNRAPVYVSPFAPSPFSFAAPGLVAAAILAFFLAGATPPLFAQQPDAVITGKISSEKTGLALGSAEIVLVAPDGAQTRQIAPPDGTFRFGNLAPGTYTVRTSYTDLDPAARTVTVAAGETATLDFSLSSSLFVMEAFTVSAEREGQAAAIQRQQQSDVIKNVVASDAFGNLIDTNAGELLKNIPGLFVDYAGEDVGGFSMRGISADEGSFTLDGNEFANSTTNPESSIGRGVALKNFSVASIESVEVYKAPPPSSPANGNGGVINMVTKNAFDQKGRRISLTANLNLNTAALDYAAIPSGNREPERAWGPGFNLYYSEAFLDNRLGISLNVNAYQFYRFNDQIGDQGYSFLKPNPDDLPAADMDRWISDIRQTESSSKKQNRAATLNLDYKLTPRTAIYLRTSFNDYKDLNGYSLTSRMNSGSVDTAKSNSDTIYVDDAKLNLTVGGAPTQRGYGQSWSVNPGVKHTFGNIRIDYDAYVSRAYTRRGQGINSISYTSPTGDFVFSDLQSSEGATITQINPTPANDYLDLNNYSGMTLNSSDSLMVDEKSGAKIDTRVPLTLFGRPLLVQAGARYTSWTRDTHTYKKNYKLNDGSASKPGYDEFYDADFENSWGFDNTLMPSWISPWKVYDYAVENPGMFTLDEKTYRQSLYRYTRSFEEAITAAYLMGSLQLGPVNILAGVRYEYTDTKATGFQTDSRYEDTDPNYYKMVTGGQTYDDFFPNVQIKYEPFQNLIFRAAYTTTIGRPNLNFLIPSNSISEDDDQQRITVSASNTGLKPQHSNNYDLSVEYYLPNAGIISAGVFRKDISDYILEVEGPLEQVAPSLLAYPEYRNLYTQYPGYQIYAKTEQNVGDARMQGCELSYRQRLTFLPGFLKNLEFYESFSYVQPDGDIDMANVKEKVSNTRITYRGKRWMLQVGYYWCGSYLRRGASIRTNPDGSITTGTDGTYVKPSGRVDLSLSWQFSNAWTLSFDWRNITNEPDQWERFGDQVRYFEGGTTMNLVLKMDL